MKFYQIKLYCHDEDPIFGQPTIIHPQVIVGAENEVEAQKLVFSQYDEYPEIYMRSIKEIFPTAVLVSQAFNLIS